MSAAYNFPSAGAASRNNRTRRNNMPRVVENTANSRLIHRNVRSRGATIPEFHLPRAVSGINVGRLPVPAVVEEPRVVPVIVNVPRAPIVTPGYGHLDYDRTVLVDIKLSKIGWIYYIPSPGRPIIREYSSFDESGRYIVAYYYVRGEFAMGGVKAYFVLIDNHGQKHQYEGSAGTKPALILNNEGYPRSLPDIIIDQIKLFADLATDFIWNPYPNFSATKYIENLQAI